MLPPLKQHLKDVAEKILVPLSLDESVSAHFTNSPTSAEGLEQVVHLNLPHRVHLPHSETDLGRLAQELTTVTGVQWRHDVRPGAGYDKTPTLFAVVPDQRAAGDLMAMIHDELSFPIIFRNIDGRSQNAASPEHAPPSKPQTPAEKLRDKGAKDISPEATKDFRGGREPGK